MSNYYNLSEESKLQLTNKSKSILLNIKELFLNMYFRLLLYKFIYVVSIARRSCMLQLRTRARLRHHLTRRVYKVVAPLYKEENLTKE